MQSINRVLIPGIAPPATGWPHHTCKPSNIWPTATHLLNKCHSIQWFLPHIFTVTDLGAVKFGLPRINLKSRSPFWKMFGWQVWTTVWDLKLHESIMTQDMTINNQYWPYYSSSAQPYCKSVRYTYVYSKYVFNIYILFILFNVFIFIP